MPLDAILVKLEKSPCQEGDAICAAVRAAELDCRTITLHAAVKGREVYAYAWLAVPSPEDNASTIRFSPRRINAGRRGAGVGVPALAKRPERRHGMISTHGRQGSQGVAPGASMR